MYTPRFIVLHFWRTVAQFISLTVMRLKDLLSKRYNTFDRKLIILFNSIDLTISRTHFFGVPRVWEKFNVAMVEKGRANNWLKRKISAWTRNKGLEMLAIRENPNIRPGSKFPFMWTVAKKVFQQVREAIGLDRCRILLTGAAPINRST